jgi:hypothetical protein
MKYLEDMAFEHLNLNHKYNFVNPAFTVDTKIEQMA